MKIGKEYCCRYDARHLREWFCGGLSVKINGKNVILLARGRFRRIASELLISTHRSRASGEAIVRSRPPDTAD